MLAEIFDTGVNRIWTHNSGSAKEVVVVVVLEVNVALFPVKFNDERKLVTDRRTNRQTGRRTDSVESGTCKNDLTNSNGVEMVER